MAHERDTEQKPQLLRTEAAGYDLGGRCHSCVAGHAKYCDKQEHCEHCLRQQL